MNRPEPPDPNTVSAPPPVGPTDETLSRPGSMDPPSEPVLLDNAAPSTATFTPQVQLLARVGRYAIRQLVGRGGMGEVYLAHDPELDRMVALKVPRLSGADAEERFLREARAAAAVSHPNLCPVYDAGRAEGVLFLTMAFLAGPTLGQLIRRSGPLDSTRAVTLASGIARGMAEAHRRGIVHRDLKPGNVLLDGNGQPVVTDFGLALRSIHDRADAEPGVDCAPRLTATGAVVGTPAYMSPEQASGEIDRVGPASDIYALGAILFEMLTGKPPYRADTVPELLHCIETSPTPVPSSIRSQLPPSLDAICRKAMAKIPADRFDSMDAFATALAPLARPARRWVQPALAGAALLTLLVIVLALVFRPGKGTVEVRLSDPAAPVTVRIDGQPIVGSEQGRFATLRAGRHTLEVAGDGFETDEQSFELNSNEKLVLSVALRRNAARRTNSASVWNEDLKRTMEEYFPAGVEQGIGRYLYGELDTAIETNQKGEWRIGAGMTRDREPIVIKVLNKELFVARTTPEQVKAWDLEPRSITRVGADFRRRRLELMRISSEGPVIAVRQPDNNLAITFRFNSRVLSQQPIETVSLTIDVLTRSEKHSDGTAKIYHHLDWTHPPEGSQEIKFVTSRSSDDLQNDFSVRVRIEAFVLHPKVGLYQISNDLQVPMKLTK